MAPPSTGAVEEASRSVSGPIDSPVSKHSVATSLLTRPFALTFASTARL